MKDGGQAFPSEREDTHPDRGAIKVQEPGMSLREYACIKLKIPETSLDWLNDLIRKSLLNNFAARAMQGYVIKDTEMENFDAKIATWSYEIAGAMLKARGSKEQEEAQ